MIHHIIHYYNNGFYYTWTMQLPFRLNQGDQIHNELLGNKGKLQYNEEETDEWITFSCANEHFEIEKINLTNNTMPRKVHYKPNKFIEPCPKCGNNTEFTIHSSQCAEDCCEIWAVCKCGYDPTSYEDFGSGNRVEDVWGGTSDGNCQDAIRFAWNDTIRDNLGELHVCQHCGVETREPDEKCYKAPGAAQ